MYLTFPGFYSYHFSSKAIITNLLQINKNDREKTRSALRNDKLEFETYR